MSERNMTSASVFIFFVGYFDPEKISSDDESKYLQDNLTDTLSKTKLLDMTCVAFYIQITLSYVQRLICEKTTLSNTP